jgi:serine/threonine-protein kinase
MADEPTVSGDSPTLEQRTQRHVSTEPRVLLGADELRPLAFGERYVDEATLGEGGMGIVHLLHDRQIGRHVALKAMRGRAGRDDQARFAREARVQGQLEHPAVVPVYDLGVDPEGRCYFTMKRVRGVTLEALLSDLRRGATDAVASWSERRLLQAFSNICLAIEFAHRRGVIHRDLKPTNVMLGDFGEVYVLDWGLAKVVGAEEPEADARMELPPIPGGDTVPGTVLGTPGYMAPEQVRGDVERIGPATDVYQLGAILFEILTLRPLHEATTVQELVQSTLAGAEARPSVRAPERAVAPELEQLVVRATALDPADRPASVRELSEAIEHFLDGVRDLELRRELAASHARDALRAAEHVGRDDSFALVARRKAMREVGRALALDPDNREALDAMVRLLAEPPERLPPEVKTQIAVNDRHKLRWIGRTGGFTYLSVLVYLPILAWVGVRDWRWIGVFYLLVLATSGLSFIAGYRRDPPDWMPLGVMVLSNAALASTASFYGPLIVPPAIVAVNAVGFTAYLKPRQRWLAIACAALAVLVPLGLWRAGLLPGGYVFENGSWTILPGALELPPLESVVFLTLTALAAIFTGGLALSQIRDALARTEQQLFLYAWHLREVVPEAIRGPTDPTGAKRAALPAEPI